jgi:PmbA protein
MEPEELARHTIEIAARAGASAAEAIVRQGSEFSTVVRLGSVEKLLQANFRKLGVRIFCGSQSAASSTSDFSPETVGRVVADTVAMARAASPDPAAGLPDRELYAPVTAALDLFHPAAVDSEEKIALARRCEEAALRHDPRINNSEGSGFSDALIRIAYCNSLGVCESYCKTVASLYACPLAELDGLKQRDYWLTTHVDMDRLESPDAVGTKAARRVLRRLGARKVETAELPVVFDPLSAGRFLSYLAEAVCGTALMRKASFLLDCQGSRVASPLVTIVDDALEPAGLGSRPFDSEGVPSQTTMVVDQGILVGYLLDSYSARKLGMRSTGSSTRELSGAPKVGPSNFYLKPGSHSPDEIIRSVERGLYVTELIGFGVNIVSGNYSQGAAGIWIERGELAYPVEEITVAGNLREMLLAIDAVGNDPVPVAETFAPTVKIGKMVVSGN